MKMLVTLGLGLAALPGAAFAASQPVRAPQIDRTVEQDRSDQDAALRARMQGNVLPMREIERRVLPMMNGARYLGFDYDPQRNVYTLKFMRERSVIWVDVDGRSGRVLGRRGN